jgi:LPPG:FO 2-phospho-L-lactate transferase
VRHKRITVLAGGVGAARFLRGLCLAVDPSLLTIVVNTGDDEIFFGLHVSPDIDTITYTLGGRTDPRQGWGVAGDSFRCLDGLRRYYPETWFQLGDLDLATHIYRTDALRRGSALSRITATVAKEHRLPMRIIPMSDDSVRTFVHVRGRGALPFQRYLVHGRGRGIVERIELRGAARARPAPGVLAALRQARTILIPPSNPMVSIGPILALAGVRDALRKARPRVAAISPLIGGRPIKGPLDRMLRGLGIEVSSVGVAQLYRDIAGCFVLDRTDAALAPRVEALGLRAVVTNTIMRTPSDARNLAIAVTEALEP